MRVNVIAARDENSGIGKDKSIPWHSRADLVSFHRITTSGRTNAVIMGRVTWESLPKGLDGRLNVIITNKLDGHDVSDEEEVSNELMVPDLGDALIACKERGIEEVWICGGAGIYEEYLNGPLSTQVSRCFITDIAGNWNCDRFFPDMPPVWSITEIHKLDAIATLRVYARSQE